MVIIRINGNIHPRLAEIIAESIHNQARAGVIVVPACCEVLNEVPADEEIQIMHQDARVAELEEELAAALAWIKAQKDCETCKHYLAKENECCCDCFDCDDPSCICMSCIDGSNWKWRGANK